MTAQGHDISSALADASEKHGKAKTPAPEVAAPAEPEAEDDIVFAIVEPSSEVTSRIAVDTASPESEFAQEEPTKPHTLSSIGHAVVKGAMSPNAAMETIAQIEAKRRND